MKLKLMLIGIVCLALSVAAVAFYSRKNADGGKLTIGSRAPELNIEHWVSNASGRFEPVNKFESGKIYVVEFWATWCGPCIEAMPHMNQLQNEYRDRGVQFIGISDEDLETVRKFLAMDVMAAAKDSAMATNYSNTIPPMHTHADVTKDYCLTTDPDGSCKQAYMFASETEGIPAAFLIGKTGLIEWIGHPISLDEPLKAVVEDRWDRNAFKAKFNADRQEQRILRTLAPKLAAKDIEGALKYLDDEMSNGSPELKHKVLGLKFRVLLATEKEQLALPIAETLFQKAGSDANEVNTWAWAIFQFAYSGEKGSCPLVQVAIKASAATAPKATGSSQAYLYDTLAHLHFVAGDLDQAIEAQKIAVRSKEVETAPEIREFLHQLERDKADQSRKDDSPTN